DAAEITSVTRASTVARFRRAEPTESAVPATSADAATATAAADETAPLALSRPVAPVAPVAAALPPVVPSVADARAFAIGQIGGGQFNCLDALWQRESGWNPRAQNPSSGAYGIPQALPGSKMATFAGDWPYNPITQV